jgi:thiosulfate/3-mercaptopyruvate sulfurtransferase
LKGISVTVLTFLLLLSGGSAISSQKIEPITAAALITWLDAPDPPLILDVRGSRSYLSGTLPGAFNAGRDPLGYLPDHGSDPVVLLTPETFDSTTIESWHVRLADAGHPVWLLSGGMAAWVDAGGEVEIPETSYAHPGRAPFLIPRGLCERGEPAQVFE